MTTTSTFQGLNTDSKPSSRVLNPPGGSSSNIFGFDGQPKKYDSKASHDVVKGTSETVHNIPVATAAPQQKSRNGDDFLLTPLGNYHSSGYKAPGSNGVLAPASGFQIPKQEIVGRCYPRSKYSDTNTFLNLFGEGVVQQRKMFRRIHNVSDDSFSRVFGQKSLLDSKEAGRVGLPLTVATAGGRVESGDAKPGVTSDVPVNTSQSNSCNVSRQEKMTDGGSCPVDQVFFRYSPFGKTTPLSRRLSPRSAFNPITGEPYEVSKPKQEAPAPTVVPSESKTVVESKSVLESAAAVNVAEPDKTQPAAAVTASAAGQQKQQHQNGPFGIGAEDVKELRSTRVTQPPGGRSTKLW